MFLVQTKVCWHLRRHAISNFKELDSNTDRWFQIFKNVMLSKYGSIFKTYGRHVLNSFCSSCFVLIFVIWKKNQHILSKYFFLCWKNLVFGIKREKTSYLLYNIFLKAFHVYCSTYIFNLLKNSGHP